MAEKASKKKTASQQKKTSSKTAKSTQAQAKHYHSRLLRLCFLLCLILLALIALLQLGIVGRFLFRLAAFFTGWMAIALFLGVIAWCVYEIWTKKQTISRRYIAGFAAVFFSLLLFVAAWAYRNTAPGDALRFFFNSVSAVFQGNIPPAGLIGLLLWYASVSLIDTTGTILAGLALFIAGCILIGYTSPIRKMAKELPQKTKNLAGKARILKKKQPEDDLNMPVLPVSPKTELPISNSFTIIDADHVEQVDLDQKKPAKTRKKKRADKGLSILGQQETPPKLPEQPVQYVQQKLEDVIEQTDAALDKQAGKREVIEPEIVEDVHAGPSEYFKIENPFKNYKMPKLTLLDDAKRKGRSSANSEAAKVQGARLIDLLQQFNVPAALKEVHIGPSVTKFEITLMPGVRVNKFSALQGDIKMALAATDIRIEAPIPGKSAVGIEIPNVEKTPVTMKEVLRAMPAKYQDEKLTFALGKDLLGTCVFGQLNKMPHLLIAGATGSGKSVCVNSIICSILLRTRPDEVKLVLIDPKKVEFTPYNDVPHLLAPVITDGELANSSLKVIVRMMDERYDLFGSLGVRNIEGYNAYVQANPDEHLPEMPRIVVIIDELADLMLAAAKEVEQSIQRITQLARAAGIHLIVATQRPSVDIITGVIKANIPSRIAFAVSQAVDSRTILDQAGAERLLGYGDMLYLPNGETAATRVQGVFIQDAEVVRIAEYVKSQGKPRYDDSFIELKTLSNRSSFESASKADPLYDDVRSFVISTGRASTSLIQRKFSVGYGRAAKILDMLEENGIVGPSEGAKPRKILVQNTLEDYS